MGEDDRRISKIRSPKVIVSDQDDRETASIVPVAFSGAAGEDLLVKRPDGVVEKRAEIGGGVDGSVRGKTLVEKSLAHVHCL